jgi:hypothetical protein
MTTYANIKLSEIFALYGNPFTRGNCKKNFRQKIIRKYIKKINFEEIIKNEIQSKIFIEGNSKLDLIYKNENGLMLLKNVFNKNNIINKSLIRIENSNSKNISYKYSSKINLNTDSFSVSSHKKRTQQELIRKTRGNYNSEENAENIKMSSSFIMNKFKENISQISK